MPSDISKPLATTSVGDLIILAFRLGMQWQSLTLDTARVSLLADGNGYVLNAIEVPGIGLVAKLSVTGHPKTLPESFTSFATELIPGRAADKMMCGIIPVCKDLVNNDLDYASDNREVTTRQSFDQWIGLDHDAQEGFNKRPNCEPHNEVISLLCDFLPVPNSNATTYYFWGWEDSKQSVFHFYEGRHMI